MRAGARNICVLLPLAALLAACDRQPDNARYSTGEVGVSRAVEFGTILSRREVKIYHQEAEGGGLVGAAAGAGAGSYAGSGSGSIWSAAGGALAGALIGDAVERQVRDSTGYEYVLRMRNGDIKTIVEEKSDDNPVLKAGDKVMMQYCDAGAHNKKCKTGTEFQRLIPVDSFPPQEKHRKKTTVRKTVVEEDEEQ